MSQPTPHRRPGRAKRLRTYPPYRDYGAELSAGSKPIVLYLRLSKYHADGADAIDRQRLDLTRKLAAEGGWTITGEYVDNDSASASAVRAREGWRALNEAIVGGAVTAVAFWKLDRTNRIAAKIIEWLGECRARGVVLLSHEDASAELNEASASAKLIIGIKSLFAEIETDTMSTRQKAAKRHAAEAGFHHGGTVPFGWQIGDRATDQHGRSGIRLVPQPTEFQALQDAVGMTIEGASLNEVGRYWQETYGIISAGGAQITAGNIRRYLTSPRLMGYRMRQVPEFQRGVKINLLDYIARDSFGDPVISQEQVCDRVTWMRLQKAMTEKLGTPRGAWGTNEWLLTGLLCCGTCGSNLFGRTRTLSSGTHDRRYVCLAALRWRPGSCDLAVTISADRAERYLLGWVAAHLSPERLAEQEALLDGAASGSPISRLAEDLDEARLELRHLLDQQGATRWKGAKVGILLGMIGDVSDRVDGLENAITTMTSGTGLVTGDSLLERWPDLTLHQKRIMLGKVIDQVTVAPGRGFPKERLTITPRF